MDVKMCDRCGEFFVNKPRIFSLGRDQNVNQICTLNEFNETVDEFDLCNGCMGEFNEFMKGETE